MSIGKSCSRTVVHVARGASVAEAAALMRNHHIGNVVVVDQDKGSPVPVGIVTDRDIVVEVVAPGVDASTVTVGELLSGRLETIDESATIDEAVRRMVSAGVRRLPVVDRAGALVGIVSIDDLLPALASQLSAMAELSARSRWIESNTRR
jgi:CBS domain-containing protein